MTADLAPAKLRIVDLARLASVGLRTRKLRAGALGPRHRDRRGRDRRRARPLLLVAGRTARRDQPARDEPARRDQTARRLFGQTAELPKAAPAMIGRIGPVTHVQYTGSVNGERVSQPAHPLHRHQRALVDAASLGLPARRRHERWRGSYLNAATATEPVCVLGAAAAQRLGIDRVFSGRADLGRQHVVLRRGHLEPAPCSPPRSTPRSSSASRPPRSYLDFDGHPSEIYVRAADQPGRRGRLRARRDGEPREPERGRCRASPPSALVAQADAQGAFNDLFLGLGAVALLVGAVGVANIMVISVLERRSEIGLRRALGATKGHIRTQFLAKRSCSPSSGVRSASLCGVHLHRDLRRDQGLGRRRPPLAWGGGSAPRSSSARSPGSSPLCGRPACRPPKRCGPSSRA